MIILLLVWNADVFSDCFSQKSYLVGHRDKNEMTLVLLPKEFMEHVTENNKCKDALDGLDMAVTIQTGQFIFDKQGTSSPNNQKPLMATYRYNQKIEITSQITPPYYANLTANLPTSYSLSFANNFVVIKKPVQKVVHIKANSTGCFRSIQLEYEMNKAINIRVDPINCKVDFDQSKVYLQYQANGLQQSITIMPCTASCTTDQYSNIKKTFNVTKQYNQNINIVNETLKQQMRQFFEYFSKNRVIDVHFNIITTLNGIETHTQSPIYNKQSVDPSNCLLNTVPNLQLNDNDARLIIMQDYGQVNNLTCKNEINKATTIRQHLTIFTRDYHYSYDVSQLVDAHTYEDRVGARYPTDEAYSKFLQNIKDQKVNKQNMFYQVFLQFLDENNEVTYEFSLFGQPHFGCIADVVIFRHEDGICVRLKPYESDTCRAQNIDAELRLSFYSQEGDDINSVQWLGDFQGQYKVNYSNYYTEMCMQCNEYDDAITYNIPSKVGCLESLDYIRRSVKSKQGWFYISYDNEFVDFKGHLIIEDYKDVWHIYIGVVLVVFTAVIVGIPIVVHKFLSQQFEKTSLQ